MQEFAGKTAIVTGAAQGMGEAYARFLAEAGCHVVLADISADKVRETAEAIAAKGGGQTLAVPTNVGKIADCEACADAAMTRFGRIDYVVNNAGLLSAARDKKLFEIDYERYFEVLDVMMHATLYLTRAALPALRVQGGAVVNTSSLGAWLGHGIYSLSKLGLNGLTIGLAKELAPFGIRVNAVAPGVTFSEGVQAIHPTREALAEYAIKGGKPTPDLAEPEDIARAGIFLLSDAAKFVNGAILNVDGGQLVRL
jgi:NAD(P)-dependent dehydrogenase (short-subunit alcohol dehydrogenase family)